MKILKKVSILLLILILVIVIVLVVDYFVDSINVIGYIKYNIFKEEDIYTESNVASFVPIKVEGNLKEIPYEGEYKFIPMVFNNKVIKVPVPYVNVHNMYSDTIYGVDGSFYSVLSKSNTKYNESNSIEVDKHKLGINQPVVIEIKIPKDNTILYIQCYTPEMVGFYSNYDWDALEYYTPTYDLNLSDDKLADIVSIDSKIVPDIKDMFLEDIYIDIINNLNDNFEGYSEFINYKSKVVSYHRSIGFLDTKMKVEYARLVSLGYSPIEYGSYKNISYIKFNELTLLGSSITKNSCLIYHISD